MEEGAYERGRRRWLEGGGLEMKISSGRSRDEDLDIGVLK